MSSRVFAPKASIPRVRKPTERIYGLSSTPSRTSRSPSPALIRQSQGQSKGPTPCKNCGSTDTGEGDGNIVCRSCGLVLSNAPNYTSDITFEEGSNGRIQQQGQRVAEGQTHQKAFAPRGLGGGPGHEATPAGDKAKTEATGIIRRYAMLLRIDEREVNFGRRIFEMAYNRGFVRGRTIESVAIVSLYIATRRAKDRQPLYDIMLIDLAEHANINVFDLGKMMQDLIKRLYLNPDGTMSKDDHFYLQAHGAEVLIDKFVNHLDFGSDANKIKTDATRILQRMKRDWLHHGRRPSGVCGAAVILAARMNNFRRTLREVVLVAKVTEFTVSKRLEEFKETGSSNLSVNDFRDDAVLGSISEMDPPAYYRALLPPKPRKKGKRGRARKAAPENAIDIEGPETEGQAGATATATDDATAEDERPAKRARIDADGFAIPALPARRTSVPETQQDVIDPRLQQDKASSTESRPERRGPGRRKGSKNWKAPPATPEEIAYEEELTSSMQAALDENQDLDPVRQLPTPESSQNATVNRQDTDQQPSDEEPSLPLRVDPAECDPRKGPPGPAVNTNVGNTGNISLDPIVSESEFDSDPEVSTCLLSEAERVLKERIWVTENADWLRQDHAKRIRRELKDRHLREQGIDPDELRKNKKGAVIKRKDGARRSGRLGDVGYLKDDFHKKALEEEASDGTTGAGGRRPSAASVSVKAMMKQRGTYSRRINYDNLSKAYDYPVASSSSPSRSPSVNRDSREQSVISVSSTGTADTTTTRHDTIGPIFDDQKTRRTRGPRASTTTAGRKGTGSSERDRRQRKSTSGSPDIDAGSATPEANEEDEGARLRQRTGSAASPEPMSQRVQQPETEGHSGNDGEDVEVVAVSPSASPLSSTHTPLGVSTPGSPGGGTSKAQPTSGVAQGDDNEAEEEDDEDEDDEEDDDDDDDDPNVDDLDEAFAGNLKERPVWEGEDEIVED